MNFEQDLERLRRNDATLTSLDLGYNNLMDEGARPLAQALTTNTTLTSLGLGCNNLMDEEARPLAQALTTNTTLTSLGLGGRLLENAFDWFLNAAEMGNPNAQCILGGLYQMGRGTPKNETKAREWYRKAAAILIDRHFTQEEREALAVPSKETNILAWKKFFMFEINMKNHQSSTSDEQPQLSFV